MYTDYQILNANVMQLHSFCSAFGIQRKEKERKVYIYTHILTNVRICVLGRNLRFLDTHRVTMRYFGEMCVARTLNVLPTFAGSNN